MAIIVPGLTNLKAFALGYLLLGMALLLIYVVRGGLHLGSVVLAGRFPQVKPRFCRGISLLPIAVLLLWGRSFRSVSQISEQVKFILIFWLLLSLLFFLAELWKRERLKIISAILLLAVQGFLLLGILGSFRVVDGALVFSYATLAPWWGMLLWPFMMGSAAAVEFNVPRVFYVWPLSLLLLVGGALLAVRGLSYGGWPLVWWGLMLAHAILAITRRRFYPRKEIALSIGLFLLGALSLSFPQVLWPQQPWRCWWEDLTWPRRWMVEGGITFAVLGGLLLYWRYREPSCTKQKDNDYDSSP